jgi:hypothetical protein
MYAALKKMFTLGKPSDMKLAALEDSSASYLEVLPAVASAPPWLYPAFAFVPV